MSERQAGTWCAAPKGRWLAGSLALALVLLTLLAPLPVRGATPQERRVTIAARSFAFEPGTVRVNRGDTVIVSLESADVVHGLTIPGLSVEIDEIYPGKVVEVDVTPSQPGRYAFACTRWCGVDHWRMRGVIDVTGADAAPRPTEQPPLFQQLGIDIDAMRHASQFVPGASPSVAAGAALDARLPPELADPAQRRALSPAGVFGDLRANPAKAALSDDDVWNLVAWAWLSDVKPATLARAETRYARDCAACHGPDGNGTGPASADLPGMAKMDRTMPKGPADFTDAGTMLAASDVLLQGKLLRGGMGTGMPEFGSLYSDEELWAMITYLRTFVFNP